jgi:uncharacterized repeat protein (TIGR03803 family)
MSPTQVASALQKQAIEDLQPIWKRTAAVVPVQSINQFPHSFPWVERRSIRLLASSLLVTVAFAPPFDADAWTASAETVVYTFTGGGHGSVPIGGLIADSSGALYGTTGEGGALGMGTVFKLTPPTIAGGTWTEHVLYSFTGGSDGGNPQAGVVLDASGTLYGTTYQGGECGLGTVFAVSRNGTGWQETVLHSFGCGVESKTDGRFPVAGLTANTTGTGYYGTTNLGGIHDGGTVFSLTPPIVSGGQWQETVLYSFGGFGGSGASDGFFPWASVIVDASGVLYGTTAQGGPTDEGAVFSLTPPAASGDHWTENVLHFFGGGNDGAFPYAALIADMTGALYGTTNQGGDPSCGGSGYGCGTVFNLTPPSEAGGAWSETILYSFDGSAGAMPYSPLTAGSNGTFYGTAFEGGTRGFGTVFKLIPPAAAGDAWAAETVHSFRGGSDGADPYSGLTSGRRGAFYGTTYGGGTFNAGTIYKIALP